MVETTTRPKSGKTKTARPVPVGQPVPVQSEADSLALRAAEILQTMYMAAAYHDDGGPRTKDNTHFDVVDHLLGLLLAPEHHERGSADPECGDIHEHLTQIADELQNGAILMDERPLANLAAPMQAMYAAMAHRAYDYADRLFTAYAGLPDTLENLRHLTTFAGMRPFRDRPQPPIRRVEAAQLGYVHSAKDVEAVFSSITSQCLALRDFIVDARTELESNGGVVRAGNDFIMVQHSVSLIGAMADEMCKSQMLGGVSSWVAFDGIHRIGGAA